MQTIPLSIPNFEGNEKKYADDAIQQGWVSTGGAYIDKFEQQLEDFLKVPKVAACQSGTSALHLSLVECGVQPNDAVIVPALTFIAAVNPVKYMFASPVFMDCDDSLCMDPVKLESFCENECTFEDGKLLLKESKQHIKAVVVVHVFGNMADMESIMSIARKYNLKVIEDATEALGTFYTEGKYSGKAAGTIGDFGAFSFNGNKIITTGGGGAVTASDADVASHLKYLSTQAKDDAVFYVHNEVGYNYRMTNVQAAIGVAQMEELEEFISRKQNNYKSYAELFKDCKYAKLIEFRSATSSNCWFYSLLINRGYISASLRDIIAALQQKGIQTRAIWGLINEQKPYQNDIAYKVEKAPLYAESVLNIPSTTQITSDEIEYVAKEIIELLEELAND
ncbi:MAG: LegC family aminotransferase [Eubacterium sp.]|nr:LegC family aminotransferase [Eubacterium sp.]